MGEKTTVDLTPAAVRHIAKVLGDAADKLADRIIAAITPAVQLAATPSAGTPQPETGPCMRMHGEPWERFAIESDATLLAFTDDAGKLRWVNENTLRDVPAGWRPVLLADPVKPRSER